MRDKQRKLRSIFENTQERLKYSRKTQILKLWIVGRGCRAVAWGNSLGFRGKNMNDWMHHGWNFWCGCFYGFCTLVFSEALCRGWAWPPWWLRAACSLTPAAHLIISSGLNTPVCSPPQVRFFSCNSNPHRMNEMWDSWRQAQTPALVSKSSMFMRSQGLSSETVVWTAHLPTARTWPPEGTCVTHRV